MMETASNSQFLGIFRSWVSNNTPSLKVSNLDPQLLNKQTDYLLGQFLIQGGLVPESTLKAVLNLQKMVTDRLITTDQAIWATRQLHFRGSNIDLATLIKRFNNPSDGYPIQQSHPLLGDILIKAGIIAKSTLQAVVKLQELVRSDSLSHEDACQILHQEIIRKNIKKPSKEKTTSARGQRIINLLLNAGLISEKDREIAYQTQKRSGKSAGHILVSTGKLLKQTYVAAAECEQLLAKKTIKLEQAILVLNHCQSNSVSFDRAVNDLADMI